MAPAGTGYVSRGQARRWLLGWLTGSMGVTVCLEAGRHGGMNGLNLLAGLVAFTGFVVAISGQGGWAWRIENWHLSDYARRAELPPRTTVLIMWTSMAAAVVAAVAAARA